MGYFKGYLLKSVKSGKIFPDYLLQLENYSSTPLQRTEIDAYRDTVNLLHRTTSPNHKTSIKFTTLRLNLDEMRIIRNWFNAAFSNSNQRKLTVEYWDDELLDYRQMTAYCPDITYQYKKISADNIIYMPTTFQLIEY